MTEMNLDVTENQDNVSSLKHVSDAGLALAVITGTIPNIRKICRYADNPHINELSKSVNMWIFHTYIYISVDGPHIGESREEHSNIWTMHRYMDNPHIDGF